jgi:hypothetical protein
MEECMDLSFEPRFIELVHSIELKKAEREARKERCKIIKESEIIADGFVGKEHLRNER